MITEPDDPAAARLALGGELARLAAARGISAKDVASHLTCSPRKANKIMAGDVGVKQQDLARLLDLLRVDGAERQRLEELGRGSRGRRERVPGGSVIPERRQPFYRFESTAKGIREYCTLLSPGLGQTEEFALAVFRSAGHSPEKAGRMWLARRERQERLVVAGGPPLVWVMSEAAIRVRTGGPDVLRRQILRLIEIQQTLPQVEVRIIPFAAGYLAGMNSPYTILEQPAGTQDRVYLESKHHATVLDTEERVAPYRHHFDQLIDKTAPLALPVQESISLLDTVAAGLQR